MDKNDFIQLVGKAVADSMNKNNESVFDTEYTAEDFEDTGREVYESLVRQTDFNLGGVNWIFDGIDLEG